MLVQFQIADFIDRAAGVYGDRIGVVDEPDQPAGSHGEVTYREIAARAKRPAAKLDELGIGFGERVAVVSHNSARLLTSRSEERRVGKESVGTCRSRLSASH